MSKEKSPGEFFKEARLKKGWTQKELAEKTGLHWNTIAKIERNVNKPDSESVFKLLEALGIEPSPDLLKKLLSS